MYYNVVEKQIGRMLYFIWKKTVFLGWLVSGNGNRRDAYQINCNTDFHLRLMDKAKLANHELLYKSILFIPSSGLRLPAISLPENSPHSVTIML
jgi:hypothetical protein